ncbi:hypothetical protein Golax_019739, partial [Gossypium laxum]|nr:hypothetical protein [Gossypium laxum]
RPVIAAIGRYPLNCGHDPPLLQSRCKESSLAYEGVSSMEKNMAELCLDDEEEEVLQFGVEPILQKSGYDLCLVRYCLTISVVHFLAMKNTMDNLWHPLGGIKISDLGEKRYLFHFFHEVDVEWHTMDFQ